MILASIVVSEIEGVYAIHSYRYLLTWTLVFCYIDMYVCMYIYIYIQIILHYIVIGCCIQIQIRPKQNIKQTKQDTKQDTLHLGSIQLSGFGCTYQGNYECPCMYAAVPFPYQVDLAILDQLQQSYNYL